MVVGFWVRGECVQELKRGLMVFMGLWFSHGLFLLEIFYSLEFLRVYVVLFSIVWDLLVIV